ncbi:MAG: DNA-binding domain-containing protein [Rubrivivax sp.]
MNSELNPATGAEWGTALLDAHRPAPAGLRTWNGSDPGARFDVHRNNVVVSLVAALADTFPVVRALVGEHFFAAMARHFVRRHPPCSPVLADYGSALPGFIGAYAPAASLPYLGDLAALEYARVQAFHAADAPPLTPAELGARLQRPLELARSEWALHPSLQIVASAHPIVDLWAAHQGHGALEAVDLLRAQTALVGREGDEVLVLGVEPASAAFVQALQRGQALGAAVARAAELHSDEALDLAATLAQLLACGWLVRSLTPESER